MAINKKLIHFKTWDKFISQDGVNGNYSTPSDGKESDGTAVYGQLLGTSIVFIKDVQKIWTHGKLYNCKDPDQILSESSENAVQNKIVASEFKRVWESIEEESKKKEVFIIDQETYDSSTFEALNDAIDKDQLILFKIGGAVSPIYRDPQGSFDLFSISPAIVGNKIDLNTVKVNFSENGIEALDYGLITFDTGGDGDMFLSDDGTYKFIETNPFEIPENGILPETGKVGKIYLIPASVTGESNTMHEYVWANDAWEKLGEFKANVDLSGYYTKTETKALVNETKLYLDKSIENLNADITARLDTKLDTSVANETLATKDEVNRKQNILVSGTNIKTINGESVLGLGDLVIDTSVLNTVGTHTGKAMSQKATTDAIQSEIERATGVENNLQTQITQHESITQNALDTASYAEALAVDANTRSQNAETVANSAIAAVRALEGLGSTDEAQTTLAERVAQIAVNSDAIAVLQEKHVLISEDDYEALEFKDPTKIYLIYEE